MSNRRTSMKWILQGFCVMSIAPQLTIGLLSCNVSGATKDYKPKVLSDEQMNILSLLADVIIPKSHGSPSATGVNVADTIDSKLYHFYNENNQLQITSGLTTINKLAVQLFQKRIPQCVAQELSEIVEYLYQDSTKSEKPQSHLFIILRKLVIDAYFQSEYVSKHVLLYDPIPGEYVGCVTIDDSTRNWALS